MCNKRGPTEDNSKPSLVLEVISSEKWNTSGLSGSELSKRTTGVYPDAVDARTAYPATEFAVVLKNFRSMKGAKAEEHLEITVQK